MPSARGPGSSSCGRRACGCGGRAPRATASRSSRSRAQPSRDAYIGVRSCDLHAIASLDSALLDIPHPDPGYAARRANVFIVALNCWQAGGTCFCVSMGTGPRATSATTSRSPRCSRTAATTSWSSPAATRARRSLPSWPLRDAERAGAGSGRAGGRAGASQARAARWTRPTSRDLLYRNYEHPRWDDVADRCLTCGNCTMVCPTCFCTSVEDVTDLTGTSAERVREWDSCFTMDFSYVHGGSVRSTPRSRYRQWMTHKLATWGDQFDTFGLRRMRALHHLVPGRDRHHRGGGRDPGDRQRRVRTAWHGGRAMKAMDALIAEVPALAGLAPAQLELIAGCATNARVGGRRVPVPRGRAGRRLLRDPPRVGGARAARARA